MAKKAKAGKVNLEPMEDRIVVQRLEAKETTAGGIVLPESAKEKPQRGTIVAVGPGRVLESGDRAGLDISVGDTVLFGKYSGTEVQVQSQDVLIMRESDILAKLD